jgi:predicted transcriptional regulator
MSGIDRVPERRRAAAVARHYRDEEGLSIAEIARRLGRAEATVKAYLYDPSNGVATPSVAASSSRPLRAYHREANGSARPT